MNTLCSETAQIIAEAIHVPVIMDSRLQERNLGNWSFQTDVADALIKDSPDGPEFLKFIRPKLEALLPPDAEPRMEFEQRITDFLTTPQFNSENILIVAHGDIRNQFMEKLNIAQNSVDLRKFATPLAFEPLNQRDWVVYKLD